MEAPLRSTAELRSTSLAPPSSNPEPQRPQAARPWSGRWCWTGKHLPRPWNTYALFRRAFDLPAKPSRAMVRISADARYALYVNGRRIHQGPARAYPERYTFDELDIAGALVAGRNAIAAVVHQFGVSTFFSVYRDAAGFLFDGEVEGVDLSTPTDWLCREARAWRKDVARLSVQLGFQEHYDAGEEEPGWMEPDFAATPEAGWQAPYVLGPVGCHPWLTLEPRPVPPLTSSVEPFAALVGQFSGENARGHKIAEDVYHLAAGEARRKEKAPPVDDPAALLQDGGDVATLAPPPDGHFAMLVLDAGRTVAGHLILDIAEAAGDEIIDVLYAEALDRSGAPRLLGAEGGPTHSREATADRYRCRAGAQAWEAFHAKGFRYVALVFRNVERPLKLRRVAFRRAHAALDVVTGSFECSDPKLTAIWKVARETQLACTLDALVDCPWREQAMWWGDARVQFRNVAYAFGDSSLFERGIRLVAQSQAADGSLHAHPPADAPGHRLPDFMLAWVSSLWDHHRHTGRLDLLSDCLPTLHRLLDFFAAHERLDGLIGGFDGHWVFLDWAPLPKADFAATLNLLYLQALRHAAGVCDLLGLQQPATRYQQKAASLQAAVEKHFFDPRAKVWRDGFDPATGAALDSTSQHANALAVLLNLKPETHATIAKDVLLRSANFLRRGKVITASPFFYATVLDALCAAGFRTEAVELIRSKWGAMLDAGLTTFAEVWEPKDESRCHAWSASPLYLLPQQVLGVTPAEPGWTSVRVAPCAGKLEFARGTVPTPLGPLRVDWEKAEEDQLAVRIDVPAGMAAEFIDPATGRARALSPGANEFHT